MELLYDTANLEQIKKLYNILPCDGITTNPTILKRENKNPIETLKEIRRFIPESGQLHVQLLSKTSEELVKEAIFVLNEIGKDTFIKIPVFDQGIKAIFELSKMGVRITATAIYTAMQGYIAAKAGALYVAPYINRLDNMGGDGVKVAKDIHDIMNVNHFNTKVLAASFKNTQHVLELCKYGIGAVTLSPEVVEQIYTLQLTMQAMEEFGKDFNDLCGEGTTMLNPC